MHVLSRKCLFDGVFTLSGTGTETGTGTWARPMGTKGLGTCPGSGVMVYSHWMSAAQGQGLRPEPGRMGCMVLRRIFHTAPEQQLGPEQGQVRMGYIHISQALKLFQVVCFNDISMDFRCPVLAPDTASVNGFCTILVSVPVPVPETGSVNTSQCESFQTTLYNPFVPDTLH